VAALWKRPPPKGATQRPASRRPPRQKIGPGLLGTIFFFFSINFFFPHIKNFFSQKRERAQQYLHKNANDGEQVKSS
jgi:hypothetical protein